MIGKRKIVDDIEYLGPSKFTRLIAIGTMEFKIREKEREKGVNNGKWEDNKSKSKNRPYIETTINELKKYRKRSLLEKMGIKRKRTLNPVIVNSTDELDFPLKSVKDAIIKKKEIDEDLILQFEYLENLLQSPDLTYVLFNALDSYESTQGNRELLDSTITDLGRISKIPVDFHEFIRIMYLRPMTTNHKKERDKLLTKFERKIDFLNLFSEPLLDILNNNWSMDFCKIAYSPKRGLEEITNRELIENFILPDIILPKIEEEMNSTLDYWDHNLKKMESIGREWDFSNPYSPDFKPLSKRYDQIILNYLENSLSGYTNEQKEFSIKLFKSGSKEEKWSKIKNANRINRENRKNGIEEIIREDLESFSEEVISNSIRIVLSGEANRKGDGSLDEILINECANISNIRQDKPYLILRELGSGKQGTVYKARSKWLDQNVAIKILNTETDEARILASLKNKKYNNIVNVEDAGPILRKKGEIKHAVVMEYLDGDTLETIVKNNDDGDITHYAIGILNGLEALSEENISYRDLRPQNIIITSDGEAKLLDFGSAVRVDDNFPAEGEWYSRSYGWYDDFFSFGLLLYFMKNKTHLINDFAKANPQDRPQNLPIEFDSNGGVDTNKDWIDFAKDEIVNPLDGSLKKEYQDFIRGRGGNLAEATINSLSIMRYINEYNSGNNLTPNGMKNGETISYEIVKQAKKKLAIKLREDLRQMRLISRDK